jgi:acetyltransferase-like isoleucine patch superfamily enzyme
MDLLENILRFLFTPVLSLQKRIRIFFVKIQKNLVLGKNVSISSLSRFKVGKNTHIDAGTILECGGRSWCNYGGGIKIGSHTYIGYYSVLLGGGEIEIGSKVLISPGTVITTQGHFFEKIDKYIKDQGTCLAKIVIEDDVWIGANSTVLPGVTVGKGSVIGAGSVVNRDVPQYSVAVGVPAKVIKKRG